MNSSEEPFIEISKTESIDCIKKIRTCYCFPSLYASCTVIENGTKTDSIAALDITFDWVAVE